MVWEKYSLEELFSSLSILEAHLLHHETEQSSSSWKPSIHLDMENSESNQIPDFILWKYWHFPEGFFWSGKLERHERHENVSFKVPSLVYHQERKSSVSYFLFESPNQLKLHLFSSLWDYLFQPLSKLIWICVIVLCVRLVETVEQGARDRSICFILCFCFVLFFWYYGPVFYLMDYNSVLDWTLTNNLGITGGAWTCFTFSKTVFFP